MPLKIEKNIKQSLLHRSIIVATNKWANKERIRVSIRPNYIIKPVFSAFLYLSITIATLFVPTYCYITHFFFLLSKIFKNIRIFNHSSFFRWLFGKIYEIAIILPPFLYWIIIPYPSSLCVKITDKGHLGHTFLKHSEHRYNYIT